VISPWDWAAKMLQAMKPNHADEHTTVMAASIGALLVGAGLGFVIYRGKTAEPLKLGVFKLFERKFFFDELYLGLVRVFQDALAWCIHGLERLLVDGLVARLPARLAQHVGSGARVFSSGNLQGYTFFLGSGVLLLIYLLVFVLPGLAK
jgi:NADH-quinone oxidoreductase subunit L